MQFAKHKVFLFRNWSRRYNLRFSNLNDQRAACRACDQQESFDTLNYSRFRHLPSYGLSNQSEAAPLPNKALCVWKRIYKLQLHYVGVAGIGKEASALARTQGGVSLSRIGWSERQKSEATRMQVQTCPKLLRVLVTCRKLLL